MHKGRCFFFVFFFKVRLLLGAHSDDSGKWNFSTESSWHSCCSCCGVFFCRLVNIYMICLASGLIRAHESRPQCMFDEPVGFKHGRPAVLWKVRIGSKCHRARQSRVEPLRIKAYFWISMDDKSVFLNPACGYFYRHVNVQSNWYNN